MISDTPVAWIPLHLNTWDATFTIRFRVSAVSAFDFLISTGSPINLALRLRTPETDHND